MKLIKCLVLLVTTSLFISCGSPSSSSPADAHLAAALEAYGDDAHLPRDFAFSREEIVELKKRALRGEKQASTILVQYIVWRSSEFSEADRLHWYGVAARNGSYTGMHYHYIALNRGGRCEEAKFWRNRYFANRSTVDVNALPPLCQIRN